MWEGEDEQVESFAKPSSGDCLLHGCVVVFPSVVCIPFGGFRIGNYEFSILPKRNVSYNRELEMQYMRSNKMCSTTDENIF